MRRLTLATAVALGLSVLPRPAAAGPLLEGSVGVSWQLEPTMVRAPVSVMLAPGWGFAGILKVELGLAGNLADTQNSQFDLELRPMVVVSPPLFPLYLRGIAVVQNLLHGPTKPGYGGALGVSFGLFGVGVFVEAGAVARQITVPSASVPPVDQDVYRWYAEGRAGVSYEF